MSALGQCRGIVWFVVSTIGGAVVLLGTNAANGAPYPTVDTDAGAAHGVEGGARDAGADAIREDAHDDAATEAATPSSAPISKPKESDGIDCPTAPVFKNTIKDAEEWHDLTARCLAAALEHLQAAEAAMTAATQRVTGAPVDAGAATVDGTAATDVMGALEQLRRARVRYNLAKSVDDKSRDHLETLRRRYSEARLWKWGAGIDGLLAGASAERSIVGGGLFFVQRPSPDLEFDLSVHLDVAKAAQSERSRYVVARPTIVFDESMVGLLLGPGAAISLSGDQPNALLFRLGLRYREGNFLECTCAHGFFDAQFFIEPWIFLDPHPGFSREAAVFAGAELSFGVGWGRKGRTEDLCASGDAARCRQGCEKARDESR